MLSFAFYSNAKNINKFTKQTVLSLFVIFLGLFINIAPTIIYQREFGPNAAGLQQRDLRSTENNSITLAQLLLPTPNHRIEFLRNIELKYASSSSFAAENRSSSLGIFGSFGLIGAMLIVFFRVRCKVRGAHASNYEWLAFIIFGLLLMSQVGGFNSLFVLFASPLIRGWNRVSVFIGFCSVSIMVIFMSSISNRIKESFKAINFSNSIIYANFTVPRFGILSQVDKPRLSLTEKSFSLRFSPFLLNYINYAIVFFLTLVSVLDQSPVDPSSPSQRDRVKSKFQHEYKFFDAVSSSIDGKGLIFQLPYWPFPEGGSTAEWQDYSHLKGYLFTHNIGWSYGGMKGREEDILYRALSLLPVESLVRNLKLFGFQGIYLDKAGYSGQNSENIIKALENEINSSVIKSEDGVLYFFKFDQSSSFGKKIDPLASVSILSEFPRYNGNCQVESINGQPVRQGMIIRRNSIFSISGWLGDVHAKKAPTQMRLYLSGNQKIYDFEGSIGISRPDVAMATGNQSMLKSGYVFVGKFSNLEKGRYSVALGFTGDVDKGTCATNIELEIVD